MNTSVSVVLPTGERLDMHLSASDFAGIEPSTARERIGELCEAAGIDGTTRTGKVLLVDQILLLAQEQPNSAWRQPDAELRRFLATALLALGRESLSINLRELRL